MSLHLCLCMYVQVLGPIGQHGFWSQGQSPQQRCKGTLWVTSSQESRYPNAEYISPITITIRSPFMGYMSFWLLLDVMTVAHPNRSKGPAPHLAQPIQQLQSWARPPESGFQSLECLFIGIPTADGRNPV